MNLVLIIKGCSTLINTSMKKEIFDNICCQFQIQDQQFFQKEVSSILQHLLFMKSNSDPCGPSRLYS